MRGLLRFTSNLELMVIPSFRPQKRVLVDLVQEKVLEEPNVSWVVDI